MIRIQTFAASMTVAGRMIPPDAKLYRLAKAYADGTVKWLVVCPDGSQFTGRAN